MNVEIQGFTFRNVASITIESGYMSLWSADNPCLGTYSLDEFYPTGTSAIVEVTDNDS